MPIPVSVSGTQQFRDLATRLRTDARVEESCATELMDVAPPVVAAVQARVLRAEFPAMPSKGGGDSSGLREHLAGSVVARPLRAAVKFVVADPRGQQLARYTEGVLPRWRHPTFGRRERPQDWIQQKPDPWFFPTIRGERTRFRAAVERAVDDIVRRLQG